MNDCVLQKKSDIGLIREKNEDSGVALSHPKDKNYKMLAIADGMGGKDLGDVASSVTIQTLTKWFKRTSLETLDDVDKTIENVNKRIQEISNELIEKYGTNKMGTTLSMAIVNKEKTVVINIGDSRCYISKNEELIQVSEDDSQVWLYYQAGQATKEDLRFFSTSNFISACIGLAPELCQSKSIIVDNNDYDLILLLTDGVTDLLTDKKISEIISKYKKERILDRIIEEAVYIPQNLRIPLRLKRNFNEPFYVPSHGKDNATGAIYIKN